MSDDHRLSDSQAPASRPVDETLIFSDGTHPEGDSPSSTPPKKFGRYEIERVLGEGAMGAVLLAKDTQLQREVALKIPKFARDAAPQMFERFFLEARLAATLSHPNICPVFDVGQIDGTHYISMAYIEGHPLSDFINSKKPQGERSAAQVIRKLALALKEAHAKGVVHRDLKPANVMIDKRGEPVIMDFGIALQENTEDTRLTREGQLVGSPAYMSPEQMGGISSKIGPATDIYSLGVVFYELLTGELPFEGTGSMASIIGEVLTKEPKDLKVLRPNLDPQLAAICLKALAKQVEDRYQSMDELAAALTQFLKQPQPSPAANTQAVSMADTIAGGLAGNNLLADLAEVLPPLAQPTAAQGTLLSAPSKQPRWLLPTAIGLAILVPAFLIWALARDTTAPVQNTDTPTNSESTAPADTNSTPAPVNAKPAPPVASQSESSSTTPQDSPSATTSNTTPAKTETTPSDSQATTAIEPETQPVKVPGGVGKDTFPAKSASEQAPSKSSSSSFPEPSAKPQPGKAEKPRFPLPRPKGDRGPPPGPRGHALPRGVTIDGLFRKYDKNRDNKLMPDELPDEIRDHLFRADTNRDGFLVKKEIRDAVTGLGKRRNGKKPR